MSFYKKAVQFQKHGLYHPMRVHAWKDDLPPKAGRLYWYQNSLVILTEQGNALVFPDEQVQAMIDAGLIHRVN